MAPGVPRASVEQMFAHVSFVVFNYDRCIEQYFEQAIASHFLLDLATAADLVRRHLKIVHPYGDLGALQGTNSVYFGHEFHPGTFEGGSGIYEISQRLLTFTQSKNAKGAEAKDLISKAKRLVFLGFGFGEQNVELLSAPISGVEHMRATVMGLSKSSQQEVHNRVHLITGKAFHLHDLQDCDCTSLINNEQMFLTRTT